MPLGSERSSGSRVRLPVRTTRLMLVAATVAPFLPSVDQVLFGFGRVYVAAIGAIARAKGRKLAADFCDRVVAGTGEEATAL